MRWRGIQSLKPNLSEMTLYISCNPPSSPRPGSAIENILIFDYLQATCNQALKTPEMSLKPKYGGMSLSARTYCQEKISTWNLYISQTALRATRQLFFDNFVNIRDRGRSSPPQSGIWEDFACN